MPLNFSRSSVLRRSVTVSLLLVLCGLVPAAYAKRSVAQKKAAALTYYATAQKMREALMGKPESARKRSDFTKAMDAFRRVYYTSPTSSKADESAQAVAELMAEYARAFNEEKSFRDAIGQYEFLRREYPGSKFRFEALFTIAQIYREDLGDTRQAQATFEEFLKRYPRHSLAEQVKDTLAEIDAEAKAAKSGKKSPKKSITKQEKETAAAKPEPAKPESAKNQSNKPQRIEVSSDETPLPGRSGKYPLVTSVRHWSTPDYTRVAIDLEEEVKYEAGRVPSPDRIFFDLHNTKLASELVGKSFEVGDGFLRKIRVAQFSANLTRIVLEVDEVAEYSAFLLPNPYRLIIDIHGKQDQKTVMAKNAEPAAPPVIAVPAPKKEETRSATPKSPATEPKGTEKTKAKESKPTPSDEIADPGPDATKELTEASSATNQQLDRQKVKATTAPTSSPTFESVAPRPERTESTTKKTNKKTKKEAAAAAAIREAQPTANGERSLIRALGLKIGRIVVDAGHGGHDTGTIGPDGLMEKDLVLDVALRLGRMLENKLGAEVIYTRSDDTFIPLETRTAIANQHQADLFISVHANSSRDARARGVETYYLNFTSDPEALEVAARENAVSQNSVFELQDLVKKIALKEKIEESREFAADVQKALHAGLSTKSSAMRDRGVKKAPFVVLIGANMPSILAEISFVSNPADEKKLKTANHRQKIADSLFNGVSRYASGLSGVKVASNTREYTGQ
ncbi:MAG TPA: N-acetylmuramoyl-L-alanine amidase [Terriglobales bacterium]|nr:N-acetylmuramoyl-L-alanine amidase [Terriglobales bacterium]